MNLKQIILKIPVIRSVTLYMYSALIRPLQRFNGSEDYWESRYRAGGTSGDGSYNKLAEFKARILNAWVSENDIKSVIEYGCGDGNQLELAEYPEYIGFDVSPSAIAICSERFSNDKSKTFKLLKDYAGETAELTLSLDVIYHLVEDSVFTEHMHRLFDSSERFVIVYSSDTDKNPEYTASHVRHRNFSRWARENKPEWALVKHIPNKYPFKGDTQSGSCADFYIYEKAV